MIRVYYRLCARGDAASGAGLLLADAPSAYVMPEDDPLADRSVSIACMGRARP